MSVLVLIFPILFVNSFFFLHLNVSTILSSHFPHSTFSFTFYFSLALFFSIPSFLVPFPFSGSFFPSLAFILSCFFPFFIFLLFLLVFLSVISSLHFIHFYWFLLSFLPLYSFSFPYFLSHHFCPFFSYFVQK